MSNKCTNLTYQNLRFWPFVFYFLCQKFVFIVHLRVRGKVHQGTRSISLRIPFFYFFSESHHSDGLSSLKNLSMIPSHICSFFVYFIQPLNPPPLSTSFGTILISQLMKFSWHVTCGLPSFFGACIQAFRNFLGGCLCSPGRPSQCISMFFLWWSLWLVVYCQTSVSLVHLLCDIFVLHPF